MTGIFSRRRLANAGPSLPDGRLFVRMILLAPLVLAVPMFGACANSGRGDDERHTQSDTDRSTMSHGQTEGSGSGSY